MHFKKISCKLKNMWSLIFASVFRGSTFLHLSWILYTYYRKCENSNIFAIVKLKFTSIVAE